MKWTQMNCLKSVALALVTSSAALAQESQPSLSLGTALNVQASDPVYAIELYSEVIDHAVQDQDRALAAFNRGVLLMGQEDPEQASDSFRIAGQLAGRKDLRRDSMFNLGHALMKGIDESGMDLAGQMAMDPEKIEQSIMQLRAVERAFLDSARIDPSYLAAKKNLERVRMRIRELEKLKQQIEDQQQQDQQNQQGEKSDQQEMADQLQKLADQQREEAQESEQADQQEQSPQEQQQDQRDLSEQTQQAQQQMQQADQSGEQQEAQQDLQEARQAQQEAQEALERGDNNTAAQKQQEAADALDRAAQRVRESQQQQSDQQGEEQAGNSQEQGEPEQEQEIDEIAQKLLDKERDERERRQAYRATGRPVRVEKDW